MKRLALYIPTLVLMLLGSPAQANPRATEAKILDPACNCEKPARDLPGGLDPELLRKIEEAAIDPEKESKAHEKKIMAKVKAYRCPRVKAPAKDDELAALGIEDDVPDMDAGDVLEELIAKAGVDESRLDSEVRDRAAEMLEKKVEKCIAKLEKQRNKTQAKADPSSNSSMMAMMMMAASQQNQQMSSVNYGANMMLSYPQNYQQNLYGQNATLMGYSPMNATYAGFNNSGLSLYGSQNTSMWNGGGWNGYGVSVNSGTLPLYRQVQSATLYQQPNSYLGTSWR